MVAKGELVAHAPGEMAWWHPMLTHLTLQPDDTLVSASSVGIRFWRAPSFVEAAEAEAKTCDTP